MFRTTTKTFGVLAVLARPARARVGVAPVLRVTV